MDFSLVTLRNVITHTGEDHIVRGLGSAALPSPGFACEVAVLQLVLKAAVFGVGVDAIGESGGALDDSPRRSKAVGGRARTVRSRTGETVACCSGQSFDIAAGVVASHRSIPYKHTRGVQVGRTLGVFGASVAEEIELRHEMCFEGDESLLGLDGSESAVGMHGDVREGRGAVTSYTGTGHQMNADIEVFGSGHTEICEQASAGLCIIDGTGSGAGSAYAVGIVAVTEPTGDAASLKVTELAVVGGLDDDIRSDVVGVVGGEVEEATACACVSDEEVVGRVAGGVDVFGLFQ